MHSLLFLLLFFCPLIFSLETITDYNVENPEHNPSRCSIKALRFFNSSESRDSELLIDERVKIAGKVIKKCIYEIALVNPKVAKVKRQLARKLSNWFKFIELDMVFCGNLLKIKLHRDECYRSTVRRSGGYFCDEVWGKDGCMIGKYDEYCGKGMSRRIGDNLMFISARQKECVDKYFE